MTQCIVDVCPIAPNLAIEKGTAIQLESVTNSELIGKYDSLPAKHDGNSRLPLSVQEVGQKGSAWKGSVGENHLKPISDLII